jgi:hypothetical protein
MILGRNRAIFRGALKALNQNGLTRFAAEKRLGLTSHSAVESRRNDDQRLGGVEDWRGRCPPPFPVPAHRTDMRISRIRRSDEAIMLSPTGRDPGQGWRVKRVNGRHGASCGAGGRWRGSGRKRARRQRRSPSKPHGSGIVGLSGPLLEAKSSGEAAKHSVEAALRQTRRRP